MDDITLQRICNQIKNEILTFRNELNKLSVPNYPTVTCNSVIQSLEKKLDLYENYQQLIVADIDDNDPATLQEAKNKLITKIHVPLMMQEVKFLFWLSKAQTSKVPWSFITCIEQLAGIIIPKAQLMVFCDNNFNYGICWSNSEKLAPYPFYVLSLPSIHRTDILWHALIGHELFHPRCSEFINKYNSAALKNITNTVTRDYKRFLPEDDTETLFAESQKNRHIVSISNVIHVAWRRGLEELLSDMACVEIFGPAALLAMNSFSSCSAPDDVPSPNNNFYPPWKYRFEIAWKYIIDKLKLEKLYAAINDNGIALPFQNEMLRIENTVKESAGRTIMSGSFYPNTAYKEIDSLLDEAASFVRESLKTVPKWYDERIIDQVPELVERLANGVPPNETIEVDRHHMKYKSVPAEIPAMFLAGWIYECYWQTNEKDQQGKIKYMEISKLLLKACEDIGAIRNQ